MSSPTPQTTALPTAQTAAYPATVTCPFCALHCDDLVLRGSGANLTCVRAVAGLSRWQDMSTRPARISGKASSLSDAVARAQRLLKKARRPLISGLGADVDGVRAALRLAQTHDGWYDPAQSEAQAPLISATQRQGVIRTTFSEVRNRADLVIVIGSSVLNEVPRFIQRVVAPTVSVDGRDLADRRVLVVGASTGQLRKALPTVPESQLPASIKCSDTELPSLLQTLAARVSNKPSSGQRGIERAADALWAAISEASYTAFVWQTDASLGTAPNATVELLFDLIARLNQQSRAAALPIGGSHGAASAMAVTTWLTGYPSRIRFQRGQIEYNPAQFSWRQLIAERATDLVVWVDAFNAMPLPECGDLPVLLIGGDEADAERATVRLPTGLPGLDHDAQIIRGDQVIALTMRAAATPTGPHAPPVRDVIHALTGDAADVLKGWL